MDDQLAADVGGRIRFHRLANGQTQEVVAGLAGITVDYLYQIERGRKVPALPVLVELARVLRIEPGALLGASRTDAPSVDEPASMTGLHRAMLTPPSSGEPMPLSDLRSQVTAAWSVWQTAPRRYTKINSVLADLVIEIERTRHASDDAEASTLAADLYGLVRTVAKRTGHPDLSAIAADRALRFATATGDALRIGAAWWNLAHALLTQGRHDIADETAMAAAERLASISGPDAAAVRGSLLQVAAVAAVLTCRAQLARQRLEAAATLASATGERNALWTAFGPINVAMHAVSVEVEAGDLPRADKVAASVAWERSPSIERRIAFLMDQANGRARRRDYGGTLLLLQQTGREAPEDLSYRPLARRLLGTVIRRAHRSTSREAVALADRFAVPVT